MILEHMERSISEFTWRDRAACLQHAASLFFGFDDAEPPAERRAREERAKLICSTCLVRNECLEYALSANESYGIWGGLTEMELKAQRRAIKNRTNVSV
jgi:WhiB family redox-sensing transcriptional regulator